MRERAQRLAPWLWVVASIAVCAQIAGFHDLRHDDAFITFRYGQNLARGHGLVFNPGERIMGSTSPGEALLSGLVYAGADLAHTPSVMAALGCIAWTAQVIALWLLLAPAIGAAIAGGVCACVLAGAAQSYYWVALETNLAAALALFALVAADRARFTLAAALCGLAALMRPDALLVAGLVALRAWLAAGTAHERRRLIRPALAFGAVVAPWATFALAWFGTVVPRSFKAKLQRASLPDYAAHMFEQFGATVANARATALGLLCIALAVIGAAVLIRRRASLGYFVAYGALHFAAYAVLRSVAGHDWHLYPGMLVGAALAITGLLTSIAFAAERLHAGARAPSVLAAGLLLATAYGARTLDAARQHPVARWNGARDAAYRSLGQYMTPRTRPGELFASVEVGTLAYYTDLRAFDIGMLVTDRKRRPAGHIRWVVLDDGFLGLAPHWPPVGQAGTEAFRVRLYEVPPGTSYFDILHARLAAARAAKRQ